jgi:hypothetical protein
MTSETITRASPERVLEEARRFFTAEDSISPATILDESGSHVTLGTFRNRLAVAAFLDPEGRGTRVRVGTLRRHDSVGKFLRYIETADAVGGGDYSK